MNVFYNFRYLRGRLSYEQINTVITEFNKVLEMKYKLLARPRAKLSTTEMKIVTLLRQQQTPETRGNL